MRRILTVNYYHHTTTTTTTNSSLLVRRPGVRLTDLLIIENDSIIIIIIITGGVGRGRLVVHRAERTAERSVGNTVVGPVDVYKRQVNILFGPILIAHNRCCLLYTSRCV